MAGKRGQISQEMIFAIGIVIIFFSAIYVYYLDRSQDSRDTSEIMEKRAECMRLAEGITGAYLNKGSSYTLNIFHSARIRGDSQLVKVDDFPCTMPINNVADASLVQGAVLIRNENGTVVLENVQ